MVQITTGFREDYIQVIRQIIR